MPRPTDRQLFEELLSRYEPMVREAFLSAVDEIRNGATLRVIVERLERGDVAGAIDALWLEPEAFARLERAIAEAYNAGGTAVVGNFPIVRDPDGNRVRFYFGVRNPEAEQWLREHAAQLVTRATEDMKEALRQTFTEGLTEGQNPTRTALNAIGRVNRATNRREGGIVGLTAPQERYVSAARRELLSGDPEQLRHYLTRGRRDKRFDRTVQKAIREETPLPPETVARITGRYADRLLELRGDAIGLNETMAALAKSREDAIQQQIEAGKIDVEAVTKVWKHTPQERPRHHHRAMNGKSVPWGEQFELPSGTRMSYPHAPDAPAHETVFCKCTWSVKIDYFASVVRRARAA